MLKTLVTVAFVLAGASISCASESKEPLRVAALAGEWTRCVAWNSGLTYNIVNGSGSRDRCFQLARVCTGNANARVTYYTPAVVVNAPYQRCIAN
jgi:hypothetical protein